MKKSKFLIKVEITAVIVILEIVLIFYLANKVSTIRILPTGRLTMPKIIDITDYMQCDEYGTKISEDEDLCAELEPNTQMVCYVEQKDGKTVTIREKINSMGFRDREFSPNKLPGRIRILAMGDSHTYGLGVAQEDTWPKNLERLLNSTPKRIEVLNLGIPGIDIWNVANLFVKRAVNFTSDIVVISFIENDVVPQKIEAEYLEMGVPTEDIGLKLMSNYTHRKIYINKSFSLIRDNFDHEIMLALWPITHSVEYEEQVKELAGEYNITVCELREIYETHEYEELLIARDGHPNELAYWLIAEKLKECMESFYPQFFYPN